MKSQNIYTAEPVIAICRAKSPAAEAGLKIDDRIIEIDGRKIKRSAEFREEINRRYAGDKLKLAVLRGTQRIERELTLADKIPPYQQPFLGVLPMRDGGEDGLKIRYVYPDSPASKAGISAGDLLLSLDGKPIKNREEMIEAMLEYQPDQAVDLEILHDGKKDHRKTTLGIIPQTPPPKSLPPSSENQNHTDAKVEETGSIKLKIAEYPPRGFCLCS